MDGSGGVRLSRVEVDTAGKGIFLGSCPLQVYPIQAQTALRRVGKTEIIVFSPLNPLVGR